MRTKQIQLAGGIAFRIELQSYRGKLHLMLLSVGVLTLIFFPWKWGLSEILNGKRGAELTAAAAILTLFSITAAFSKNIIQIDPGRRIRKGWVFFGMRIWLGEVAIFKISRIQLDTGDRDNPVIKCLDPAENSVLAIEGLRDCGEALQIANYISSLLGSRQLAIQHLVKDLESPHSSDVRTSLRWGIALASFLYAGIFAYNEPLLTLQSRIISATIAMFIPAMALCLALPDGRLTSTDTSPGTIRGWYRHRFFWICSYVLNLRESPDPLVYDKHVDKWIPVLGLVLICFGATVFLIPSIRANSNPAPAAQESIVPDLTEQQREQIRIGGERMREVLKKRDQVHPQK